MPSVLLRLGVCVPYICTREFANVVGHVCVSAAPQTCQQRYTYEYTWVFVWLCVCICLFVCECLTAITHVALLRLVTESTYERERQRERHQREHRHKTPVLFFFFVRFSFSLNFFPLHLSWLFLYSVSNIEYQGSLTISNMTTHDWQPGAAAAAAANRRIFIIFAFGHRWRHIRFSGVDCRQTV